MPQKRVVIYFSVVNLSFMPLWSEKMLGGNFCPLKCVETCFMPWYVVLAASQVGLAVKNHLLVWEMQETRVRSLGREDPQDPAFPRNHLILCHPLLLLPPIHPSIRVFSNESTLCMRWPKYWSLCDPIDSSPPGSPVPGILQERTLEWVAISFSNA